MVYAKKHLQSLLHLQSLSKLITDHCVDIQQMIEEREQVTDDELIGCIGIEHLLSSERARRRHNHRREHAQNVLAKQDSCTVEELCQISKHSSKQSRYKAYCLAVSNHKIGR